MNHRLGQKEVIALMKKKLERRRNINQKIGVIMEKSIHKC
jgi:hypothetical protein